MHSVLFVRLGPKRGADRAQAGVTHARVSA
jgi:hypothetical protein